MPQKPNRDQRIVEAIESCRPHSGDVSDAALSAMAEALAADPQWEELYRRCQRCDARLAAAFADVPVPEGLASRILASVAAGASAPEASAPAAVEEDTEGELSEAEQSDAPVEMVTPRAGRRRWLAAAAVLVGLAASVVLLLVDFHRATPLSQEQMLGGAIDFFNREGELPGTLLSDQNEPEAYPFSNDLYRFAGIRYRPVERFLDREAMAYDMTSRLGVCATLYVVSARGIDVEGLPAAPPPFDSALRTLGCASAAWQSDGLVYVLVVGGGSKRAYDSFLPLPGPVT